MVVNPYKDKPLSENKFRRTFKSSIDDEELVWHRDRRDRQVTVLEGEGWKFQYDNKIPFEIKKGETIDITKNHYHRLLKGDGDLILEIIEKE